MEIINYKLKIINCFLLLAVMLSGVEASFSQQFQPTPIKKSEKIETIDGKKFYIHHVEKSQTLYSIAKTYGTTVDIVLSNNPDAIDGLKAGDKLKIPFLAEAKKEITAIKDIKENIIHPVSTASTIPTIPLQNKDTVVKPIADIHVAVFLPLSLSAMENRNAENFPEETKMGIEFYEGIKMAYDSLKKQGFKGHLHIYDAGVDSAGMAKLLSKPELKTMNLFIGPLSSKKFEAVLKIARENKINIVSPTLQGNTILLGNPNVSKTTPSYATQAEALAKYAAEKFAGQNIILFNSASAKDKPYINMFRKTINPLLKKANADTVKEVTFTTLKDFLIHAETQPNPNKEIKTFKVLSAKPNIVVIPSTNPSIVTEAVNKLFLYTQQNGDSIIVLGMSNFQEIESLDFGYLNALHVIISSYELVDYNNPQTKKIILNYRSDYKTEPTRYVFSGFDAGYFYLSGLQKYGTALQSKLPELKQKGIQTEFNFVQSDIASGYENKGVGIMKFENYSYTRVK
ncbi:MAG: ABC transporter substrate-binding protein [Bacteroidetes bacterium]|nr:ABC transporter substrate-binding protein [Bacteroidota bacterium]